MRILCECVPPPRPKPYCPACGGSLDQVIVLSTSTEQGFEQLEACPTCAWSDALDSFAAAPVSR